MNSATGRVQKIWRALESAERILIPFHLNPDGDSAASCLSFGQVLEELGKRVLVSSSGEVPSYLSFLPGFEKIQRRDLADLDLRKFDLLLLLDPSSTPRRILHRFTERNLELPSDLKVLMIDHHPHSQSYPEVQTSLVDADAASTTEILHSLFRKRNVDIDASLATALLVGILTDSGFFQFPNTTSKTLEISAELLDLGVDYPRVLFLLLRQIPPQALSFWAKVLENIEIFDEERFLISHISNKEISNLGLSEGELNQARGRALALFFQQAKGSDFGILLTETKPGIVRGSIRARTKFDVLPIAKKLGGGGHALAAGFALEMGIKEAREKVLEVARQCVMDRKKSP